MSIKLIMENWKKFTNEASKPDFLDLDKDGDKEESMKDAAADAGKEKEEPIEEAEETAFAPSHYCIHHGGVQHEGKIVKAEAISHNYDEKLGKVTFYDMKLLDGTILENVNADDILVTSASLAEEHSHSMKRDDEEDD